MSGMLLMAKTPWIFIRINKIVNFIQIKQIIRIFYLIYKAKNNL